MIIAVTGHQRIPGSAWRYVRDGVRDYLASRLGSRAVDAAGAIGPADAPGTTCTSSRATGTDDGVTLVSCLAVGADQRVAAIALELGCRLEAMVPSHGYETTFDADGLDSYRRLLARAAGTVMLGFDHPCGEAYMAAGRRIVDECDELLAVWDGFPSDGLGGTGDVVAYARRRGVPVHVVWPTGVRH